MNPPQRGDGWDKYSLIGMSLVNVATFSWATNIVLGRWLRNSIGPLTLSAARFGIAAVCFLFLLKHQRRQTRSMREHLREHIGLLLGMALTGVVAFAPTLYQGLRLTTAVNATLITGSGPLITGALAAALIQEPMTRRQTVAAVAGLVGVSILITGERSVGWQLQINPGDLVILGATTLWGLYTVLSRRATRYYSALSATAYSSFLGLFFLIPAAGWETRTLSPEIGPTVSLAVLYIGFVPTVLGFVSWNEGIRRLGPGGASIFYNTLPLFGAVLSFVFLNEPIGLHHLIGGSLIIGSGLWAAQRRQ